MNRKLMILKGVLLLRRFNRYLSKEEQLEMVDKCNTDEQIAEWVEYLRNHDYEEKDNRTWEEYCMEECESPPEWELRILDGESLCKTDYYSPSNPWDAPGASIRDFI